MNLINKSNKFLLFVGLFVFMISSCKSKKQSSGEASTSNSTITWLTVDEAEKLTNKEGKMYFVDLYTDWCGWCKVMDKKTFTDPQVIDYFNKNFHAVKFNAEQREEVVFGGQKYEWMAGGRNGINKLTIALLGDQISFPAFAILDNNKKVKYLTYGYQEADPFLNYLKGLR
jgi:thioredoxin-related protein